MYTLLGVNTPMWGERKRNDTNRGHTHKGLVFTLLYMLESFALHWICNFLPDKLTGIWSGWAGPLASAIIT